MVGRRGTTRSRLLDAACALIAERGISAPIEDICARAGYSRGAFYSSFSSKEALWEALWQQHSQRQIEALSQVATEYDNVSKRSLDLAAITQRIHRALGEDTQTILLHHEFLLLALRSSTFAAPYRQQSQQVLDAVSATIRKASSTAESESSTFLQQLASEALASWEKAGTDRALRRPRGSASS